MLQRLLWIALAGAAGALARYGLSGVANRWQVFGLPTGTILVNLVGCFCFGAVWAFAEERQALSAETRIILLAGFLGAFTTFSTFGFETLQLWRDAKPGLAVANALIQNIGGIIAAFIGIKTFSN